MGEIVRRKKKGRPSKADLAKRAAEEAKSDSLATESDTRRSVRRRHVKYNIDYDDYVDEEDEDDIEDEDDTRREKKLKLVLKLPTVNRTRSYARDGDAHASSEEFDARRMSRKTKIDDDGEDEDNEIGDYEEKDSHGDLKGILSEPGRLPDLSLTVPLPDRKKLELILDKLQKKDIYGVYAEPVDPEELPDYHEIIEHPMDFASVRKKLASGSYSTLKQIESDVYLICANAMQYNAPDTVYYKQARTIQELARKKFVKVRIDVQNSEKELKSELKAIPNSFSKKPTKNAVLTSQEPVGSDFSAGPTYATVLNLQNSSNVNQSGGGEKRINGGEKPNNGGEKQSNCGEKQSNGGEKQSNGGEKQSNCGEKQSNGGEKQSYCGGTIEASYSLFDNNLEKTQEVFSGKGLLYKFGRKSNALDENRRATYSITTNLPIAKSDSIYATFDGEHKQLVAVGLHAEHSYARSMACFAASLGPFSWKSASKRIEQALPVGYKFGRGWVGEYEPFSTPVLIVEKQSQKETASFNKTKSAAGLRTDDRLLNTSAPTKESFTSGSNLEGKSAGGLASSGTKPFTPINTINQNINSSTKNHVLSASKAVNQAELNFPFPSNHNKANFAEKPFPNIPKLGASREIEAVVGKKQNINRYVSVESPSGKVINSNMDNKRLDSSSSDSVPCQMVRAETFSPRGQVQSLNGPSQSMRPVHENAQKTQISSNNSLIDSNNAAATAARAWMSIGAAGFKPVTENSNQHRNQISADLLYNPARNHHSQMLQIRGEFPPNQTSGFVPQKVQTEAQFQNRTTTVFPHLGTTNLSGFQIPTTPWRGLTPHVQPQKKQNTFPPDLNISFQPSNASPVTQSAGVLVDSQQPDLALQL